MKKTILLLAVVAMPLMFAGCMTGNQAQPSTEIEATLFGKPVKGLFPKDASIESAHVHAESNGTNTVLDIDLRGINAKNNPNETAASYKGQVDMFNAGANAVKTGFDEAGAIIKTSAGIP